MIPFCNAFIKGKVLTFVCRIKEHQEQEEHGTFLLGLSNNFGQDGSDLWPDFHSDLKTTCKAILVLFSLHPYM